MSALRDIVDVVRNIDKTPFVAGKFDSSQLIKVLRKHYPDIYDSLPSPPNTPIGLKQITAAELRELDTLPRYQRRALAREVREAADKAISCHALRATPLSQIAHCAPLFAVWQRVKYRLIYDLRAFNLFSRDPTFSMETIADAPTIARGCTVGGKLDLKSAYWQIPLAPDLFRYMGATIDGSSYTWRTLPFGLALAPRLFTDIVRPLLLAWRSRGIRVLVYLDDVAVFAEDTETYARHVAIVMRDLVAAGLRISPDKAFVGPYTTFELLGLNIDLTHQAFSVPSDRAHRIADDARTILSSTASSPPTALDLTSFLGRVAFAGVACPWLAFFRASLVRDTANAAPSANFDPKAPVSLSDESRAELRWWVNHSVSTMTRVWRWSSVAQTTVFARRGTETPVPQFEAASDASDTGVGLRFGPVGSPVENEPLPPWLPPSSPSAARELYGLARLVESGRFPRRATVRLLVDAQAAVGTWLGPSVTSLTARAARRLFRAVVAADIDVILDWLPRELLFDVDAGSRVDAGDMSHAMVPPEWLSRVIGDVFAGSTSADAEFFASSHNRCFPSSPCGSRRPDPAARLGDGISTSAWSWAQRGWAYPPFGLARRVIDHVNSMPTPPNVILLLPRATINRTLRHFTIRPGPDFLLAPPSFKRRVAPPMPLDLCIPTRLLPSD